MPFARRLLWIDCSAGLVAGLALVTLAGWLSPWYGLPPLLLRGMGAANLLYAAYSFSLARRAGRPRAGLLVLIAANATWAVGCAFAATQVLDTASGFGVAHLLVEGLFVGALAASEWALRDQLVAPAGEPLPAA